MRYLVPYLGVAALSLTFASDAFAQRDAGSKIRGEYSFYGRSAGHSMRSAVDYSRAYREYAHSAPEKKINPEVAKETTDAIGSYITKSQKHMAWMRKQAGNDKQTLASLDVIDKHLADAAKAHEDMCKSCMKESIDAMASMECCQTLEKSLTAAIDEHDKLMKRLGMNQPVKK